MPAQKSDLGGLRCPVCGGGVRHASVIDTRYGNGFIRRRRACENEHRFTTRETIWARQPEPTPNERLASFLSEYVSAIALAKAEGET